MKICPVTLLLSFMLSACSHNLAFESPPSGKPHAMLQALMVDNGVFRANTPIILVRSINGLPIDGDAEAWRLHAYSEFAVPAGDTFLEVIKQQNGDFGYIRFLAQAGETYTLSYQSVTNHRFMLSIKDSQQYLVASQAFEKHTYPDYAGHEKDNDLVDAIATGDIKTVQRLLREGADPNWQDPNGWSPIPLAALESNFQILRLLVDAGGKIDTIEGSDALRLAAKNGNIEILQYLLEKGADINLRRQKGNSALMEAAKYGHVEIVKLLLQNRAYTKFRNGRGKTAMDLAKYSGFQEVADMLKVATRK